MIGVIAAAALLVVLWLFLRGRRRRSDGVNGAAFKSSLPSNELEDGSQHTVWQQPGNVQYQQRVSSAESRQHTLTQCVSNTLVKSQEQAFEGIRTAHAEHHTLSI